MQKQPAPPMVVAPSLREVSAFLDKVEPVLFASASPALYAEVKRLQERIRTAPARPANAPY